MSKRNWYLFLEDVLESTGLIEEYIRDMNFDNFGSDRKTIELPLYKKKLQEIQR